MPELFHLQIVTPEREVFSGQVEQITLPGADASFGVLRNHAPLIAALGPGVVTVYDDLNKSVRFVIGGGFFQVAANQAIVLADSAELPHEIDVNRAEESEGRARERLEAQTEAGMQIQRDRAAAALRRARVRLRNATGTGLGQG